MTGATARPDPARDGSAHDALFFGNPTELLTAAIDFAAAAIECGEHLCLACTDDNNHLIAEALGDVAGVTVVDQASLYSRAPAAVDRYQRFATGALQDGATGLRLLGQVPTGHGTDLQREWGRFEAVVNHALGPLPIWSMCAYDTTTTGRPVLDMARATHPWVREDGRRDPNPAYVEPAEYLGRLAEPGVLAIEAQPPAVALMIGDVTPDGDLRLARARLRQLLRAHADVDDFVLAVYEVMANAVRHGSVPVTVRLWTQDGQAVCTVTDRGPGFDDPYVGYERVGSGMGLWVARQLCTDVAFRRDDNGFTVRLRLTP